MGPANGDRTDTPGAARSRSGWTGRLRRWTWLAIRSILQLLVITWATLAISFSNLPWEWMRLALAVAFAVFAAWALWMTRRPRMGWAFAGVLLGVIAWFISIRPSHDRPWRAEVAVLPRATIDGDRVRIDAVRDFVFRSRNDFTARYEPREFSLAHAASVDLFISYWSVGPVGHTFVSFNFDDGTPPLCVSIETRPEVGEGFSPLASMFKQFELIYIVGTERDLVGHRASHRSEEVYLYPLRTTPEGTRRLLRLYLERINELADRPEFYHLFKNSCTINIVRYANTAGRSGRFDPRHVLNGWIDRYLYAAGWVDTTVPFAELRQRSRITDAAKAAEHAPDFSARIRASLTQ
jgi:hypothetical protein